LTARIRQGRKIISTTLDTISWEQSEYAEESRVDVPLTDELLASIEAEPGYKLPIAYVELARIQNGGIP
jgi:hypothetical protein